MHLRRFEGLERTTKYGRLYNGQDVTTLQMLPCQPSILLGEMLPRSLGKRASPSFCMAHIDAEPLGDTIRVEAERAWLNWQSSGLKTAGWGFESLRRANLSHHRWNIVNEARLDREVQSTLSFFIITCCLDLPPICRQPGRDLRAELWQRAV